MRNRLVLTLCLLCLLGSAQARAEQDTVGWMASRLLSGKDIVDYELALKKFVSYSDLRVLPTLLKMADLDDTLPRAEAAGVLWLYNNKEVRERLVFLAKDSMPEVQIEAAKSLCLMKYMTSLSLIQGALLNKDAQIRARALRALATVKGDKARAAVETLRSSKSPVDQIWIAFALYHFKAEPKQRLAYLKKVLTALPPVAKLPKAVDPGEGDLAKAAKAASKGATLRAEAAQALYKIGTEPALEILVEATADLALADTPDGPRRLLLRHGEQAASALASGIRSTRVLVRLGSVQTVQNLRLRSKEARATISAALAKSLSDESSQVRQETLRAIAKLELRSLAPKLTETLGHADTATRRNAARVLGILGIDDSVEALIARLKSEQNISVRRTIYKTIAVLGSPRAVDPMFNHLRLLYNESRQNAQVADEIPLCMDALAAGGSAAADKALELLPRSKGTKRKMMIEILARSGSSQAIDFFMEQLRESPPAPDGPQVRFFDSLGDQYAPMLEDLIQSETAMWIRVILARALFRMGKTEYGRGIIWGLKHKDAYLRKLAAALARGLKVPGSKQALINLLTDEPQTALFASRSLLAAREPWAVEGFLGGLESPSLRKRSELPVLPYWEGQRSATHPFSKEVDNDRVWVVFADDRFGRKMDLFITWSADGRTWNPPVFTGLTSFADPEGQVPPPTFSLKVRGRDITIALTRTFAQSSNPNDPRFKTLQRVHRYKLQDLFKDRDNDELPDLVEKAIFSKVSRADSDSDGLLDGKDKNPLAKPASLSRNDDVLKVLAFSHAYLNHDLLPRDNRLLVVVDTPGARRAPELSSFPHLVLHLKAEQIRQLWKATGGGFPRIQFGPTKITDQGSRATQSFKVMKGIADEEQVTVFFRKTDGQWTVSDYREQ